MNNILRSLICFFKRVWKFSSTESQILHPSHPKKIMMNNFLLIIYIQLARGPGQMGNLSPIPDGSLSIFVISAKYT